MAPRRTAALNVNGGGLVFDREMGFGMLDAEAAVKLARFWTLQSTAANEQHLGGSFVLPAEFGATSQSITVTIDNPGNGGFSVGFVELTLEVSDLDLKDLSIELVSPEGTKALIAPNLHAAGGRTYLDFTFSSVVTLGENPFGTWTLNLTHATASDRLFGARRLGRHLWRQQGKRRHALFHVGLCPPGRGRSRQVDRHRHQWRHRHAQFRRRGRQARA